MQLTPDNISNTTQYLYIQQEPSPENGKTKRCSAPAQKSSMTPIAHIESKLFKRVFKCLCPSCCTPHPCSCLPQHLYTHLTLALTSKPLSLRVFPAAIPPFSICQRPAHPSRGSSNIPSSMKACPALPDRIICSLPSVH